MNTTPTIPCPVCREPILIRSLQLPSGEISRIYIAPLQADDNNLVVHQHQIDDVALGRMH